MDIQNSRDFSYAELKSRNPQMVTNMANRFCVCPWYSSSSSSALPYGLDSFLCTSFYLPLTLCINSVFSFSKHIFKTSRYLIRCLPLLFFQLIFHLPCCNDVSIPYLFMACPKNLACLSLILTHNFFRSLLF